MSDMKKLVADDPDDFSDVPELSLPSTLPSNYEMRVESDVLEPVVFSQSFCRFTLQKKGFLSHQSKITFSVAPTNDNPTAYFPLNIGVNSLIKRCVLKAGAKTLAETDDFNQLQAYRSAFIAPENNYEREQYLTGRLFNYESEYVNPEGGVNPNTNAPEFGVKTGMNIDYRPAIPSRALKPFATIDGTSQLTIDVVPTYAIFIADLFDCFYNFDMPMYMIDDEVHIELHFEDAQPSRVCLSTDAGNQPDSAYNIVQDDCRMLYDTIYYDGDTMEKHRQKKEREGGVVFSYVDYRVSKRVADQATWGAGVVQNVGGAGRIVDKVIYGIGLGDLMGDPEVELTSKYQSDAPDLSAVGAGAVKGIEASVNLFYNDRYEFPTDRTNLATLFSTTATAEGIPLQLPKAFYGNECVASITGNAIEGRRNGSLFGTEWWNSVKLMRGERVNNQGINFHFTYNGQAGNRTLWVWLALKRTGVIKGGRVDCYFQ